MPKRQAQVWAVIWWSDLPGVVPLINFKFKTQLNIQLQAECLVYILSNENQ